MTEKHRTALERTDLIYRVLDLYDGGITKRTEIAKELGVGRTIVSRIIMEFGENREQILAREVTAWKMRQRGKTFQQIADELLVDRSTIGKILKRLNARILEDFKEEVAGAKITQWQQMEYMISELLDAWERSKEPSKSMTRKQPLAAGGERPDPNKGSVESVVKEEDGNLAFIREARAVMADMRSLLGLAAPVKVAATDPSGDNPAPGQVMIFIPDNGRDSNSAAGRPTDDLPINSG